MIVTRRPHIPPPTTLLENVHALTFGAAGVVRDAAVAWGDGRITWVGPRHTLPTELRALPAHDGGGGWVTPGFIDAHTHLVYAGDRLDEFEARANGATYAEIAAKGGGILSTVRATRAATEDQLVAEALPRLRDLLADGVTTVEIKSGYGLDLPTERRMLRTARRLGAHGVDVQTTLLALHARPPEHATNEGWVEYVTTTLLPTLHAEGLVDAVDTFCEHLAFTPAQCERVYLAAQALDLPIKGHTEQLSWQGGTALVARLSGLSADHLEHITADDIAAMAAAGTVAVLLPGAYYTLRDTKLPPVAALRAAGVPICVSTDHNPGTSPHLSLLAAMNLAVTLFGLTPAEALAGVTVHAARALGLPDRGRIEPGLRADLAVWDVRTPAQLTHALGGRWLRARVFGGDWRA